jgi:hypothetical protein
MVMKMGYERVLTVKITLEMSEFLNSYCKKKQTNYSDLIRKCINGLKRDKEEIEKEIEFHNLHIKHLEQELMEEGKKQEKIVVKKVKEKPKYDDEVMQLFQPIWKEILQKFGRLFKIKDVEEKEILIKKINKLIDEMTKKIDENIKPKVVKQIQKSMLRMYNIDLGITR